MTAPRRRLVRSVPATSPTIDHRRLQRIRVNLDRERTVLARWMSRLRRAFHAVEKSHAKSPGSNETSSNWRIFDMPPAYRSDCLAPGRNQDPDQRLRRPALPGSFQIPGASARPRHGRTENQRVLRADAGRAASPRVESPAVPAGQRGPNRRFAGQRKASLQHH